jgi:RNA polymerase sigma-70 factor (family 1)
LQLLHFEFPCRAGYKRPLQRLRQHGMYNYPYDNRLTMEKRLTDKQLVKGLNNGDTLTYNYVFREWYPRLCFVAMKLVGNKEEAEDIVTDTLTRFYRSENKFDHVENVEGYLYASVRNGCLEHIRKMKARSNKQMDYAYLQDPNEETIENIRIKAELIAEIIAEIKRLPDTYRNVFEMSFLQGLKNEEIAKELNISPDNVRQRKARAINMLRLRLSQEGLLALYIIVSKSFH